jgi:hypothetical protein
VLKAEDGTAGHGTFVVEDREKCQNAIDTLKSSQNFGGAAFSGFLLEEYIPHERAKEYSVQGIVYNGKAEVYGICQKDITKIMTNSGYEMREAGHIAYQPSDRSEHKALAGAAQESITCLGYKNGPFHFDLMMLEGQEQPYYIEMDPRPAGSYDITNKVSGRSSISRGTLEVFSGKAPSNEGQPKNAPQVASYLRLWENEVPIAEKMQASLPPGVDMEIRANPISGSDNMARMMVSGGIQDEATVRQVLREVTSGRFRESDLPPLGDVNLETAVTETSSPRMGVYPAAAQMSAQRSAATEDTPLLEGVLARPLTRYDWIAQQANKVGKDIVGTIKQAVTCCR